jgi:tetratricopeptide (TPR) repeat protein
MDYAKTCFIVMPFGKKSVDGLEIDFDFIYQSVFLPAISDVALPEGDKLQARRTDQDFFSGDITVEMFRYLEYSRFVLADITSLNPNVFYELGVRHRARQSGTAIFRQVEVKLPFDIAHIKAFPYEYQPEDKVLESRKLITRVLRESLLEDRTDNVIRLAIAQQERRPRPELEALRQAAENALRRLDYANAINLLRQAVQADQDDVLTPMKLGILLKEQGGRWEEAAELFQRIVAKTPGYSDAWRELGVAQGKMKQDRDGEASLREAIKLNAGDFDAMASLGGILKRRGELNDAASFYRQSVRVSNGHPYPLLNALTLEAHLRGSLDISKDRLALSRAEKSLRLQVADDPPYNAPWSLFDLAQIRLLQKDREGFLEFLAKGVENCTSGWMPKTFRETLELLPGGTDGMPGLAEGIKQLQDAEAELGG